MQLFLLKIQFFFILLLLLILSYRSLLAWRNMLLFFLLAIFMVPANLYKIGSILPFDLEPYRLVAFFILLLWTAGLLLGQVSWRKTAFDRVFFLLYGVALFSFLVNLRQFELEYEFSLAFKALINFATFFLIFYFVKTTCKTSAETAFVFKFILVLTITVSVFGVIERLTGYNIFRHLHDWLPFLQPERGVRSQLYRGGLRVSASQAHPIALSGLLGLVVPLVWHYWQSTPKSWQKVVLGAGFYIILLALLLTGSRTGLIGVGAIALFLFVFQPQYRRTMLLHLVLVALLSQIFFPGTLEAIFKTMSLSYLKKAEVGNRAGRLEDYPRILNELMKKPLFGRGYGTFDPNKFFYVDNQYLLFLVELGLVGIFAFLVFLGTLLRTFLRQAYLNKNPTLSSFYLAISATVVFFTVVSAFFDSFAFSQIVYLFFVLVALGSVMLEVEEFQVGSKTNEVG